MNMINLLDNLQKWQDEQENNRSVITIACNYSKGKQEVSVGVAGDRDNLLFSLVAAFDKDKNLRALCEAALMFEEWKNTIDNAHTTKKQRRNK